MLAKLAQIFKLGNYTKAGAAADGPKRYNDAVLIIRQDNSQQALHVEASNFLALQLLGGEMGDVVEKDLRQFLPENIKQMINENIEFSDHGRGIDSVLNRVTGFKIKSLQGSEIPLKIRVIRGLSSSSSSPRFQLVMNDSSLLESLEANRQTYRADMRGDEIFDKATGLATRQSILKDMELISFYTERNHKSSCFAIFKFINYDDLRLQHDDEGAFKILTDMIKIIESTKRKNDIIGLAAEGAVILIFPETPKENIKIPITRIHNKLPQNIKSEIRIYYNSILPGSSPEAQLDDCMKGMGGRF